MLEIGAGELYERDLTVQNQYLQVLTATFRGLALSKIFQVKWYVCL